MKDLELLEILGGDYELLANTRDVACQIGREQGDACESQ